jgi:hypothetical protein
MSMRTLCDHYLSSEDSLLAPFDPVKPENSCAKVTIPRRGFKTTVAFGAERLRGTNRRSLVSKHDSVTKRKRRPKSDKRVDYTARTMAAIKQHSEAAKLGES